MHVAVELVVISGRSGSGKTVALRALEDLGFYCIDNLPVEYLSDLISKAKTNYPKLAVSIDIRNLPINSDIQKLTATYYQVMQDPSVHITIIFLDANDQVLVQRYAETRRIHPLSQKQLSLDEAVIKESNLLSSISSVADLRINTTNLSIHDLTNEITTLINGKPEKKLLVIFESFGFKDGLASDADFVFDCRFLPNPYWEKNLRKYNGLEEPIRNFFLKYPEVDRYINQLDAFLMEWLPKIESSNRSYLTVALGCTGGFHRSVYVAQTLCDNFIASNINAQVRHRSLIKAGILSSYSSQQNT